MRFTTEVHIEEHTCGDDFGRDELNEGQFSFVAQPPRVSRQARV